MTDTVQAVHEPCPFCDRSDQLAVVGWPSSTAKEWLTVLCGYCQAQSPPVRVLDYIYPDQAPAAAWAAWDRRTK